MVNSGELSLTVNIFLISWFFYVDMSLLILNRKVMSIERKIIVTITNQDFADKVDFVNEREAPLYNAVKRAFSENNIQGGGLRLGTFNINTKDAQLGKLDKPFDDHDHQRLFNKFLKGIPFEEKREATIFANPIKFQYPHYSVLEDTHYEQPNHNEAVQERKEYTLERNFKLSIPTSLLALNEVMEYLIVSGI